MPPAVQRFEVAQIFAECRAYGLPLQLACFAAAAFFDRNGLTPPASILEWLAEMPADQWRPAVLH